MGPVDGQFGIVKEEIDLAITVGKVTFIDETRCFKGTNIY